MWKIQFDSPSYIMVYLASIHPWDIETHILYSHRSSTYDALMRIKISLLLKVYWEWEESFRSRSSNRMTNGHSRQMSYKVMMGLKESHTKPLKGRKKEVGCLGSTGPKERLSSIESLHFSYYLPYALAWACASNLEEPVGAERTPSGKACSPQAKEPKQPFWQYLPYSNSLCLWLKKIFKI